MPRETRYVRTYVSMGLLVGRIHPKLVSAEEGREAIAELAYIGSEPRETPGQESPSEPPQP